MNAYRTILEVLKWTVPLEVLTTFSIVSVQWRSVTVSEELWMAFGELVDLYIDEDSRALSHKDRYRCCRRTHTLALLLPAKLLIYDVTHGRWEKVPMSQTIAVDKSSAWASVEAERSWICSGGGAGMDYTDATTQLAAACKVTNRGTVTTLPDLTTARKWHGAVVCGLHCYVFGGVAATGLETNHCERIDWRHGQQWASLRPMLSPRSCFNPCVVQQRIYLIGSRVSTAEVYYPLEDAFEPLPFTFRAVHSTTFPCGDDIGIITGRSVSRWNDRAGLRKDSKPDSYSWGNMNPVVCCESCYVLQAYNDFQVMKVDLTTREIAMIKPPDDTLQAIHS